MIKFDPTSIYNRAVEKLQQDPNWKAIVNNSVISAILKSNAEINSETARYAEYLFKESKWDTAQNSSSILAMSNMLGYQPKRKISAQGRIYVSADPRTHLVGTTISSSSFKNLTASNNTLGWVTPSSALSITSKCDIVDSNGVSYIASPVVFNQGHPWCSVDIIQGKRKSVFIDINTIRSTATTSRLDPYLYVPLKIVDCEDASNTISKAYFRVYVMYASVSEGSIITTTQEYRPVDSLLLSTYSDYDVEVYNDIYNQQLFYLKFNNDAARGRTLDISQNSSIIGIRVDYVETLGEAGNLLSAFQTFTISNVSSAQAGVSTITKLYGINFDAIVGGKNEETVIDVKNNAPKFYINNYSAGTKEAYENSILNMEFAIESTRVRPKKVQVYGSTMVTETGTVQPITCISFIADGIEDVVTANSSTNSSYSAIEEALNYYLSRLKSPQDVLKFVAPNYVPFALGLTCTVSRGESDLNELSEEIRNFVEEKWSPTSDELDFGRDFYPSKIINEVMNNFEEVVAIKTEVEAVKKLNWNDALRMAPYSEEAKVNVIHTCRIPFNFNNVFLGHESTIGFRDHRVGADYVMRFDFMYKKPSAMVSSATYHTSLFIQESGERRDYDAFYLLKDTSNNYSVWPQEASLISAADYSDLASASKLNNSWQFRYRDKVYSDDEFKELINEGSSSYIPTLTTYLIDPGTIDDYLVYYSSSYPEDGETIGNGWIEITFEPIYRMLSTFALYDVDLAEKLRDCPLALLKCGNLKDSEDTFNVFIETVQNYVDIYVSLRPIDEDLTIDTTTTSNGSAVLYIDSYDGSTSQVNASNLTADKRSRMISITCKHEE